MDFLLKSFSLRPFRCRSCRKRFYMRKPVEHAPELDVPEEPQSPQDDAAGSKANS
jgi:hypothetical protein